MSDDFKKEIKEFKGLDMLDIIGSPLASVIDGQTKLASVSKEFIEDIGFGLFDKNEATPLSFDKNSASNNDELPSDKQNNSDGNDGV